jgi:hypothetical protein
LNRKLSALERLQEQYRCEVQELMNRVARAEAGQEQRREPEPQAALLDGFTVSKAELWQLVQEARHVARQLVEGAGYQPDCECLTCRLRREHAWLQEAVG